MQFQWQYSYRYHGYLLQCNQTRLDARGRVPTYWKPSHHNW